MNIDRLINLSIYVLPRAACYTQPSRASIQERIHTDSPGWSGQESEAISFTPGHGI
ncbi:MAG: hypothetical protein JST60_12305 [Chloroflexi bacterium SZAS-1]|nr:hypothetical protein [Chloroflexi bacterium SZAS-1]